MPISLWELPYQTSSKITGLSRYYFLRLFSHKMGMPPHAYLESVRLIHAKRLIKAGLSLNEIAYATCFSDQSHFINRFKQYLGVTPGQYAKGLQ
jgi:AraC-like DNA-binding protein